jgi:hypothetical protein
MSHLDLLVVEEGSTRSITASGFRVQGFRGSGSGFDVPGSCSRFQDVPECFDG